VEMMIGALVVLPGWWTIVIDTLSSSPSSKLPVWCVKCSRTRCGAQRDVFDANVMVCQQSSSVCSTDASGGNDFWTNATQQAHFLGWRHARAWVQSGCMLRASRHQIRERTYRRGLGHCHGWACWRWAYVEAASWKLTCCWWFASSQELQCTNKTKEARDASS
jgi:hypothetical protein